MKTEELKALGLNDEQVQRVFAMNGADVNREKQAARRQLTICETGIGKLEARIADMDRQMEAVACDPGKLNELYQQKQALEQELEEQMARWEELSLLVEE